MPSTVGRIVVAVQTNKSGGAVAYGDVVITDAANDSSFTTTTSGGLTSAVIGVCVEPNGIANNSSGRIQYQGECAQVNANASVTRGNFVKTHTVAKQATGSASRTNGTFGVALTTSSTPKVLLWGSPDVAASGNVAADTIWDAAGDLAVGSGADTAARLAKGAAGGALSMINAAVAWNSGTSFPGSAVAGDRYWRTDRGLEYYYDGTRWLTCQLYRHEISNQGSFIPMSVNGSLYSAMWAGLYDIWVVDFFTNSAVITTNTGSAYWTILCSRGPSGTSLASYTTAADTVNVNTGHRVAVGALTGTSDTYFSVDATKTSTPGNLYLTAGLTYRLVG